MTDAIRCWSKQKYFAMLFLFYLIAHGGILLIPNAIYWDDWTLYQVNPEIILDTFHQAGSMFNLTSYIHNSFLAVGPWFYKILTFILMFGAGVSLDRILKKHESLGPEARFLIVLFFLVLPFYWARVALIDIVYTISYFLFFFAWVIMDRHRFLALFLFFLSFSANSLLVFYALPFLDYYYRSVNGRFSLKSLISFSAHKIDFFLLPFIFFTIKIFLYPPNGLYEGYNEQYNFLSLFKSPVLMILDWMRLEVAILAFLFLTIFAYGIVSLLFNLSGNMAKRSALILFLLGFVAFVLAGFPYWILGYVPTFSEWTSRHQLLLPLGCSLLLLAFLAAINIHLRPVLLSIILSLSMILNLGTYKDFYFDWQKQKALITLMAENQLIRNADLVVFDDRARSLNAINRTYRNYEWNGLLANSFDDETRFGINKIERDRFIQGNFFKGYFSEGEKYRNGDFDPTKDLETVMVSIQPDGTRIQWLLGKEALLKIDVIKLPITVINLERS